MGEHVSRTQNAVLLVEDGPQEVISINKALHQNVGFAVLTHCHSATCTLVLVVAIDVDGFNEAHLLAFLYGIAR